MQRTKLGSKPDQLGRVGRKEGKYNETKRQKVAFFFKNPRPTKIYSLLMWETSPSG